MQLLFVVRVVRWVREGGRRSDSEIRLGDWQTFQKFGAAGARCVPTMVGRAAKKILRSRQPFLIGKWPLLGAIPLVGAQRSSQAGPAAFPSTYTFRMEAQTQRRAQTKCKSICTTKLVDSAKTAEPKMAFNFAHLLSAACGGAPHRLRRLRRPWWRAVRAPLTPSVVFVGGSALVSLDLYRISTLVAKLRNRKWRLILRTCCPPPAAALRAAWGACGAPLAGGRAVCTAAGVHPVHHRRSMACSGGARLRSRGFHTRESGFYIYENIGRP